MLRKLTVSTFFWKGRKAKRNCFCLNTLLRGLLLYLYSYLTKITFKLYSVSLYKPGELLPKLGFQVPYL